MNEFVAARVQAVTSSGFFDRFTGGGQVGECPQQPRQPAAVQAEGPHTPPAWRAFQFRPTAF